ncbi:MAG TPA: pilus assembly protein PilM [Bacteroidota bacterium]|nr:pilus assembly protein PilM [Bacteroidota bacterium]
MKTHRSLGVSFYRGNIQIAEVEQKKPALTALAEGTTGLDIAAAGTDLAPDHPQLVDFIDNLKQLLKSAKVGSKTISFALPPESMFINSIPVDVTLKGPELTSYLQWEIQQYFPNAGPKDFITDFHALPHKLQGAKQTFVVSVKRGVVGFLQNVAAGVGLQLAVIDIDHFSTEKTLRVNYPEIAAHTVALFGIRKGALDASLVHKYEMIDYRPYVATTPEEIHKAVLHYVKYLKQRDGIGTPEALILHGMEVPREILKPLHEESGIQALAFNAMRKLTTPDKLKTAFGKESYRFTAAIGLALRTPQ